MKKTAGKVPSSTVAIGTAALFVMIAALTSFIAEDRVGQTWSLRGTLVPGAETPVAR